MNGWAGELWLAQFQALFRHRKPRLQQCRGVALCVGDVDEDLFLNISSVSLETLPATHRIASDEFSREKSWSKSILDTRNAVPLHFWRATSANTHRINWSQIQSQDKQAHKCSRSHSIMFATTV